jgi:flagellar biosynthetic protein FlhB
VTLAVVGVLYLKRELATFGGVTSLPLVAASEQVAVLLQQGLLWLLLTLAAFAAIDVPLQRLRLGSQLKMSHTEVKEESKEAEGNGEIKQRQRQRMREMANRRMLAAVPSADLVVMNPSHYAVALRYDEATMSAPRVVAKGSDLMAFRIRDAAKGAKVPVLQAPPLARALYAHAEIDREVPAALFAAVAQVLAYVYQLREALAGRVPMPNEPTELPVPPTLDPMHGRT